MATAPPARTTLVVGASSTIGAAVAARLAARGDRPVLWGRDLDALTRAAEACRAAAPDGPEPVVAQVDVTDDAAVAAALTDLDALGPLGAVVWAAGTFDWGPAHTADPAAWRRLLDVTLVAAAAFTPRVLPLLVRAAPATLVYLGSGASRQAYPDNAAYVAAKHGLAGLARATFEDVRDLDVAVSLVSPGLVAAGAGLRSPAGQERPETLLAPDDVADAVAWVVGTPPRACPVELELQPQRRP